MERDISIHDVLTGLWAEYPAMKIRMRDVRIDEQLTVFRATIILPTGTEVSGYGGVEAFGVAAIAEAQARALAQAISLLGLDAGEDEVIGAGRLSAPYEQGNGYGRQVAESEPVSADPLDLGPAPSAAEVAAATGMRLGVRPGPASASASAPAAPGDYRETAMTSPGSSPDGANASSRPAGPRLADSRPSQAEPPQTAEPRAASPTTTPVSRRPRERVRSAAEEEAGVSQKSFWLWAAERGLSSREDVEALLGQSISGMRPSEVRDRILDAEDEANMTDD